MRIVSYSYAAFHCATIERAWSLRPVYRRPGGLSFDIRQVRIPLRAPHAKEGDNRCAVQSAFKNRR